MTKPTGWCCSLLDEENWLETKRGEHVLIIFSLVVKWIFRAQWNKTLAAILLRCFAVEFPETGTNQKEATVCHLYLQAYSI